MKHLRSSFVCTSSSAAFAVASLCAFFPITIVAAHFFLHLWCRWCSCSCSQQSSLTTITHKTLLRTYAHTLILACTLLENIQRQIEHTNAPFGEKSFSSSDMISLFQRQMMFGDGLGLGFGEVGLGHGRCGLAGIAKDADACNQAARFALKYWASTKLLIGASSSEASPRILDIAV